MRSCRVFKQTSPVRGICRSAIKSEWEPRASRSSATHFDIRHILPTMEDTVDLQCGKIYRKLSISAPWQDHQSVDELRSIASFCQELTVKVGEDEQTSRRKRPPLLWHRRPSGLAQPVGSPGRTSPQLWSGMRSAMHGRARSDSSPRSPYLSPRLVAQTIQQSSSTSLEQRQLERQVQADAISLWRSIFGCFERLDTLTIRVGSDAAWPDGSGMDDMLVTLRIALELAGSPRLERFRLAPLHAGGIITLRWHGFGALRQAPANAYAVWRNITTLDIQLQNPVDALSASQRTMFLKILQDYLSSFAPTLTGLRFVWLGTEGPDPLTLDLQPGMNEGHNPITWQCLGELWLGNISQLDRAIRMVPSRAPSIKRLRTLRVSRPRFADSFDSTSDWVEILLGVGQSGAAGQWAASSSVYSQSTGPTETNMSVSRTSRELPFVLDL